MTNDWVYTQKCYRTPYFGVKTKVIEAPRAQMFQQCVWHGWVVSRLTTSSHSCSAFTGSLKEGDRDQHLHRVGFFKCVGVYICVMSDETHPTLFIIAPLYTQLLQATQETPCVYLSVRKLKEAIHQDLWKRYRSEVEKATLDLYEQEQLKVTVASLLQKVYTFLSPLSEVLFTNVSAGVWKDSSVSFEAY